MAVQTQIFKRTNLQDAVIDARCAAWEDKDRVWLFPLTQYDNLLATLKSPNKDVKLNVKEIPSFLLKLVTTPSPLAGNQEQERIIKDLEEELPARLFRSLMRFQVEGVAQAVGKGGRVLLGDEMGLGTGKTIQALSICAYYEDDWPVLVICPSSLRLTWAAEIEKWLDIAGERVQVIFTAKDVVRKGATFVIVSYDLASKDGLLVQFEKAKFQIVVADESHYLKSRDAKRTKAITPLLKQSKRVLLLTGTPALSRPIELFTQLSALLKTFLSVTQFGIRYCDGKK
ncbi:hypothetical protein HK104_004523, partial [Borealophlyctis nickersoniae]